MIDVYYYGAHIHSETHDFCEETSCPVSSGDFMLSHSQSLPGFTPPVSPLPHWSWDSIAGVPLLDVLSGTKYVKMFHKFASEARWIWTHFAFNDYLAERKLGMLDLPLNCSAHCLYVEPIFLGMILSYDALAWQTLTWAANLTRIRPPNPTQTNPQHTWVCNGLGILTRSGSIFYAWLIWSPNIPRHAYLI